MSLLPGHKKTEQPKHKTGGSLWDAYNNPDRVGTDSMSFINDKKRMFGN